MNGPYLTVEQCEVLQRKGLYAMKKAKYSWVKGIFDETSKNRFDEIDWEWHIEKTFWPDPEYPYYYILPTFSCEDIHNLLMNKLGIDLTYEKDLDILYTKLCELIDDGFLDKLNED